MNFDPNARAQDDSGIFGLNCTPEDSALVLIPVPFDATTSYGGGASEGPGAILHASHQVDLFDIDTGRPYEAGICMLPEPEHIRALNVQARALAQAARQNDDLHFIAQVNSMSAQMNDWVRETTRHWLSQNKIVGLVGGDHSTPFGCISEHVKRFPEMGILHIDAHADLRVAYEGFLWSHASIMDNVMRHTPVKKLVQVGIRDFCDAEWDAIHNSSGRITTFFDRDLAALSFAGTPFNQVTERIVAQLPHEVFVSFDIDGLDPLLCPHTGTPVPGGLSFQQACALLIAVKKSGRRIIGFDVNEVAPGPNGDEWDGNVGARILYKLCGLAIGGDST